MNKTIGIGALVSVLFYFSGIFVILTPLPLVYVSATSGRKGGIFSAAIAFSIIVATYLLVFKIGQLNTTSFLPLPGVGLDAFFSIRMIGLFGGGYFLFFLMIAMVLGEALRQDWGIAKAVSVTMIVGFAVFAVVAAALYFSSSFQIVESVRGYFEAMVGEVAKLNSSSGAADIQIAFLTEHGPDIARFILRIIPSLVFVFAFIAVVVNLLLSMRFIKAKRFNSDSWNIVAFSLPDVVIWFVIGSAAAFLLGQYVSQTGFLKYFGINLLIALASLYFFQGLAVVMFFVRKIRAPFLRLIVYLAIIFFFQMVALFVVGLGIADVWVGFRSRTSLKHTPS